MGSIGLNPDNLGSGRVRSSIESVLIFHMREVIERSLRTLDLFSYYCSVEMEVSKLLVKIELNGFGELCD